MDNASSNEAIAKFLKVLHITCYIINNDSKGSPLVSTNSNLNVAIDSVPNVLHPKIFKSYENFRRSEKLHPSAHSLKIRESFQVINNRGKFSGKYFTL